MTKFKRGWSETKIFQVFVKRSCRPCVTTQSYRWRAGLRINYLPWIFFFYYRHYLSSLLLLFIFYIKKVYRDVYIFSLVYLKNKIKKYNELKKRKIKNKKIMYLQWKKWIDIRCVHILRSSIFNGSHYLFACVCLCSSNQSMVDNHQK